MSKGSKVIVWTFTTCIYDNKKKKIDKNNMFPEGPQQKSLQTLFGRGFLYGQLAGTGTGTH